MLKQTFAFGLLVTGALGIAIAPASANDVQSSNQIIHSTTVAVDDSHATSYNTQQMYQNLYDGYGYFPYGDNSAQAGNQIIQSNTIAIDDSTAISDNDQFSALENYETGYWGYYPYPF